MAISRRCVLVGAESLLIQCAQVLEQQGHVIVAMVSDKPAIARHAVAQGIPSLADTDDLLARFAPGSFDVLFSITHLAVLPPAVLALPALAAINFHDGPLPGYAGLNTPVWALLNGERRHGVAWHLMTDRIDAGDILAEAHFDVADDDTALTLNTRCFEAAIETFADWVGALGRDEPLRGTAQGAPGDADAPRRTYRRNDRPDAACTIDWRQPAARIVAMVRALDFGGYNNPVGAAKLAHGGRLVIVTAASALQTPSRLAPGSVVDVGAEGIVVATASQDVQLRAFATLDGAVLTPAEAAQALALMPGAPLDLLQAALAARLTALNRELSGHEAFWLQRLETQTAIELPYIDRTAPIQPSRYEHLDAVVHAYRPDDLLAAFACQLARLADKEAFEIGFAGTALTRSVAGIEGWFAPQVPMSVRVDFGQSFAATREAIAAECAELRRRHTYATDQIARYPELRKLAPTHELRTQSVAVVVVASLNDAHPLPGSELTLAVAESGDAIRWIFDEAKLAPERVSELSMQLTTLLEAGMADGDMAVGKLPMISAMALDRLLNVWNATAAPWRTDACVHRLFEEQAARTPSREAITCGGVSITYAQLDQRANQLARRIVASGVNSGVNNGLPGGSGPDALIGLCVERSIEMMVGLIAIHKSGAAYLPLDPTYPKDRLAYMVDDSRVKLLITQQSLVPELPPCAASVIRLDTDWPSIATESAAPFDGGALPHDLAYVIYTSGSTGKPKGVMVEHRNVVNFFAGMDRELGPDDAGVWLAVTSLSFDISVLELCWTLARGYTVVIAGDDDRLADTAASNHAARTALAAHADRPLEFSLFYFSSDESEGDLADDGKPRDKYRLLLEGAKYADRNGFSAVWTPERHFHAFGGLYPNPAVTGAAIAAVTEQVQIRAGSVVLPLHHPARVAEEWSVVDNISKGRVGISFASGWQPDDFVLRPENFADNKNVMLKGIETVRRLWRGESESFPGPLGKPVSLRILPRPVQPELPYWVTSAGNPETFIAAGRIGARVLTHLLGQTTDELRDKLAAYRRAWKEAGHPGEGFVSLMLHSFVGPDAAEVRKRVKQPLIEYLRSSLNLVKQYAWSFPAFKRREGMDTSANGVDLQSLAPEEMDALLEHSFERYYESSGLFGTPEHCLAMIDRIKAIGVDDVACLIDFGVDSTTVLEHLPYLNQLREASKAVAAPIPATGDAKPSLAALMQQHRVTHLQCTPSMARMLVSDDAAVPGLRALRRMMVGGEAFPPTLARDLTSLVGGTVMNMYGPTETTIWSATQCVDAVDGIVPLGRPLANQEIYILDRRQQPLPVGVPGELVIGGAGVVRGYLHRPQLTDERFVPHPLRPDAGRVYRTGDLARQRDDGVIEFLGRLDHQVKVRGYRIELGEIEAGLLSHPSLHEAVVLAREDTPGDVRLVAYVVARPGEAAAPADLRNQLRDHLRECLPEYMVPGLIVFLLALPQTPNGKIDRKALPAPEAQPVAPAADFVAPSSDIEQTIATVWKDVLKLPQVGIRDNFFDLGGHSLLAVQAHRRLRDTFRETLGRSLSITDIFRFPTIQSLSQFLGAGPDGAAANAGAQAGRDRAEGRRAAMHRRGVRPGVTQ